MIGAWRPRLAPALERKGYSKFAAGLKDAQISRKFSKDTQANTQADPELIKALRKPDQFFRAVCDGVKSDLRAMSTVEGDGRMRELLTRDQREMYQETVFTNMAISEPISANFLKSCLGLPLMGGAIYSHLWAGLTDYIMRKQGLDLAKASTAELKANVFHLPYYRSPVIIEELKLLGYSTPQIHEMIAKAFFLQYNHGDDPLVFNKMTRNFYPPGAHVLDSARDLGRETEFQAARLFALGLEGLPQPLTIHNAGDTSLFTDGAMSFMQHLIEAEERGIKMPVIFMVNANNSSISSRISLEGDSLTDAEAGVRRIVRRFELWGDLLSPGFVVDANNAADGVQMMQSAVDQVLATGKPTWAVCKYPFRPVGHASDASPASDELLVSQFHALKKTLVGQVCSAAEPGTPGADLAEKLQGIETSFQDQVKFAMNGTSLITRGEICELSTPGVTEIEKDPGHIVDLPVSYFSGKGHKGFAGMGTDIYSQACESLFTEMDSAGRAVRYIHQENHHKGSNDTRCGVYGELNTISDKHLNTKFVNFLPNEAQVAQVAAGYKSALPPGNIVICKGPHTPFNEHAADLLKYIAYRTAEAPERVGLTYIIDGSNLTVRDTDVITTADGKQVERSLHMARVGQHHNSPFYAQYAADANTICSVPVDMNLFAAMLPEMVRLQDFGRISICFLPTPQFGRLHPAIPKGAIPEGRGLTQNDILRVTFEGKTPLNGKDLVVVAWGPDTKWIAETLIDQGVKATMLILNFMKAPNSMIAHLDDVAQSGVPTEVICVDPNPDAAMLAPVINVVQDALDYPDNLHFAYCFVAPSYAPHGAGEGLIQAKDFLQILQRRGLVGGGDGSPRKSIVRADPSEASATTASTSAASTSSSSGEEIVVAPLDGENVVVSYRVKVGDAVKVDDVVAEVESDKANVDVLASAAGTIKELCLEAGKEMNVTMDTKVCVISCGTPAPAAEEVVTAPLDGENVVVSFSVKPGAEVKADDVVAVIESDKAAVDVLAPSAGTVKEFFVKEGVEMNVTMDTKICSISGGPPGVSDTQAPAAASTSSAGPAVAPEGEVVKALSRVQLAMVDNMTVKVGDSRTFTCGEPVQFKEVVSQCKQLGVTPNTYLIKTLADSLQTLQLNKKLSADRRALRTFSKIDIGVAVEVAGQLRVAVVRDAANKSVDQIGSDIDRFLKAGAKLSPEDQDLDKVCFVLSSLGKSAPEQAVATLPRGQSGILAIGRAVNDRSNFVFSFCHATLNGSEGAALLMDVARRAEGRT